MSSFLGMPTSAQMSQFSIPALFFTIIAYSFVLFKAAELIGTGSEKLLLLYGPGVVGGLVIPILGAIPDGSMVLFSGLGPCAQVTLNIGIGTLAGSTIMLITIPLAGAIFLGRRDMDPETQEAAVVPGTKRPKYENGFSWTDTVITTNGSIPVNAKIMMATGSAYLFVLIPALIYRGSGGLASHEHYPVLGGVITCMIGFVAYSIYQTVDGSQQAEDAYRQEKSALDQWKKRIGTTLSGHADSYKALFSKADKDGNNVLDREELGEMLHLMGLSTTSRAQIFALMEDMQLDDDRDTVSMMEFERAITRWGRGRADTAAIRDDVFRSTQGENTQLLKPTELQQQLTDEEIVESLWDSDRANEESDVGEFELDLSDSQVAFQSVMYLVVGTLLTFIFSGPMVTAISSFSAKAKLNPFFISFFLTPLAGNIAEIYASLLFARKKTVNDVSLAVSSLYGAACMNNTFVLGIFCILVFAQKLAWTYTIETISILITLFTVGYIGRNKTIRMYQAVIILGLFPLSVILIGTLQRVVDGAPIIPKQCR